MELFLWWAAVVLAAYFGVGIALAIWKKIQFATWAVIVFLICLVYVFTMQ